MNGETAIPQPTRMIFLGDAALTDGFRLIGFETRANPTVEQLERLLRQLLESHASAFLIIDHRLATSKSAILDRVRLEGGRIVIAEVPTLDQPDAFHCQIDDQLKSLFGDSAIGGG